VSPLVLQLVDHPNGFRRREPLLGCQTSGPDATAGRECGTWQYVPSQALSLPKLSFALRASDNLV